MLKESQGINPYNHVFSLLFLKYSIKMSVIHIREFGDKSMVVIAFVEPE
jgi:hypothetical protein